MRNRAIHKIGAVLIAAAAALVAVQPSRADIAELLHNVNLVGYSRRTMPPEFAGHTADGRELSSASLRGKVAILNFWATWCIECRGEMPAFEQLHRQLLPKGLVVLGINAREGAASVRNYANEIGLRFPLLLDLSGNINSAYGVIGLPTTFVIARDGRAVALAIGPREWSGRPARALIDALLAEPAAWQQTR
jgi:cytochrome c biogenesis protein CcmG, thiol:disulfide interchange protein DsbE